MKRWSMMCLNSCANEKRCRAVDSFAFRMIVQRPLDHWVAPDTGSGLKRCTCKRGCYEMIRSLVGASFTCMSFRKRAA